ncbi:unnamed protein product [Arctogadus glacialis]
MFNSLDYNVIFCAFAHHYYYFWSCFVERQSRQCLRVKSDEAVRLIVLFKEALLQSVGGWLCRQMTDREPHRGRRAQKIGSDIVYWLLRLAFLLPAWRTY